MSELTACHFWFRNQFASLRAQKRKQMLQPETGSRVVSCHRTAKFRAECTAQKLAKTQNEETFKTWQIPK